MKSDTDSNIWRCTTDVSVIKLTWKEWVLFIYNETM